jgi:hypothetical protein
MQSWKLIRASHTSMVCKDSVLLIPALKIEEFFDRVAFKASIQLQELQASRRAGVGSCGSS